MISFHFLDLIIVCLFGLIGLIGIFGTMFWIWMIVDCATNEPSESQDKIMWILIIVLTHFIAHVSTFLYGGQHEREW